jgi:hypothetical protein
MMSDKKSIKLSRQKLYDEIWEDTATGVSKKYNVPYADLLKQCKEAYIPIPPSGYWTKLRFEKPVSPTPLPESEIQSVELPVKDKKAHISASDSKSTGDSESTNDSAQSNKEHMQIEPLSVSPNNTQNIYNREKLYKEVWEMPVVKVAKEYGVSDVAIHKVCKSMNIPVPPRGYWAKVRAGQNPKKQSLPATKGMIQKTGARTQTEESMEFLSDEALNFLEDENRQIVLAAAQQMKVAAEDTTLHKKIREYKSIVKEWNKNNTKPLGAQRDYKAYTNRPPFLARVISNDSLGRVYKILDTLFRSIENLGGSINDDLSIQIRDEHVSIHIVESQSKTQHEMSRQEAQEMMVYEDEKRHRGWASKPQIRKYDYSFNGRLRISIDNNRYFKDTGSVKIESRLGEVLIALYEESERVRIEREKREEKERKEQEAERLRKERINRYNDEIDRTNALANCAKDYSTACEIRNYIAAVEANADLSNEDILSWLEWAKKKADWFDPTVSYKDQHFGKREHEHDDDTKVLKKKGYSWWDR